MKWIGQNIYDQISKFRNTVDFSKDVTFYQPVNNANPTISIGSSDDERLGISINYKGTTTQEAQLIQFTSYTESGTAHDGRFVFSVDQDQILNIQDGGIDFAVGKGIGINGVDILTDNGSGTATLSNIDALDATTEATIEAAIDTLSNLTGVGTIVEGVWQGTTIKTAYIGDDQVTEDKLANTLLAEIDANTAKVTNVATNLTASTHVSQIRINSSDGDNVIIAEASGSIAGVMSVTHHDKLDAIEASATADQSKSDIDGLAITTVGTLDTGNATAIVDAASATAAGKVELATTAEAITGTDTARAVTPAGLKARISQIVNLQGYAVLEDDNYLYSQDYVDSKAPFLMSQDYGSGTINSSTEVNQKFLLQAHGFHVPFACTVGPIQVQVACSNAGNISVALVEYVPSNSVNDQNDYPRTIHETVVVVGTGNIKLVNTVDVTAANVDNKTIAAGSHLLIMVKGDGTSAGGTAIIRTSVGFAW